MPEKEKVEEFWGGLWSTATHYKQDTPWLHTLHNEYATDAQQKEYEITDEILEKVLSKMANDKPGKDMTHLYMDKKPKINKTVPERMPEECNHSQNRNT